MKTFPCLLPLITLLMLISGNGSGEDLFYRSNDFGMGLARIAPYQKGDPRWVLEVRRNGRDEVRLLFNKGKEVKRWEFTWNNGKTERVERQSAGGVLTARRIYDASGSLLQEEEYAAGVLSKKTLFTYANGRLSRTRTIEGPDDRQVWAETYLYSPGGGLREVRRTVSQGEPAVSTAVTSATGLSEERSAAGGSLFVERYDTEGRLINRERRADGVSVSTEDFSYGPGSRTLTSSEERLSVDHGLVSRRYDEKGSLSQETRSVNGSVKETVGYERDAKGNVSAKTRKSAEGSESWKYTYSESGDLSREEYSLRGILVKVIVHGEGKLRTEELYKDRELFMKVYYDADTRFREEVYSNGILQRERSYP
jgi:antitoxin component YwqK of YwqJK toxin-antitoxin module